MGTKPLHNVCTQVVPSTIGASKDRYFVLFSSGLFQYYDSEKCEPDNLCAGAHAHMCMHMCMHMHMHMHIHMHMHMHMHMHIHIHIHIHR